MVQSPEIGLIDSAVLAGPVRRALADPMAAISHWEHHPISYIKTEVANLGVHRFSGLAQVGAEARPWSLILKAVHAPPNDADPTYWNYHRREFLAYQAGLLESLPGGLSAPRCYGLTEHPGSVCWLWLEDLQLAAGQPWSLSDYARAARHLGQFNGAYAAGHPLPAQPWLSRNWLRGWLALYEAQCQDIVARVRDGHFWENAVLRPGFSRPMTNDILRLWANQESLLSALERLPKTFCHMDAYRPNLFFRGAGRTAAIDWVFAGIGAIGEEIANLMAASLIWFGYDAEEAGPLGETIFAGYLDGLRDAGWQGDARLARLGFTAACALRWGLVGLWWTPSLDSAEKLAALESKWGRPLPELVAQFGKTSVAVLELAAEALQLQHSVVYDD